MDLDTSETTMSNNTDNSNNNVIENFSTQNGHTQVFAPNFRSKYDTDVVRLIGQHLVDLGLKQTVDLLLEESGLKGLDHPVASKFQQHIMSGDWNKAKSLIEEIMDHSEGDRENTIREMRLIIAEQQFLELIDDDQFMKALKCLRSEITPLTKDHKHIDHLCTLLLCRSKDVFRKKANWPGKGHETRQAILEKLQKFVPPFIMLPQRRLSTLLSQAVQLQKDRCPLHTGNSEPDYIDLKTDHKCGWEQFPLKARQELDNHKTEVWYCKFSNDGTKLATGGLYGKIIIWDLDPVTRTLTERCSLDCNNCHSITCLSWSPKDVYLLACGSEFNPDLWIWNIQKEELHNMIRHSDDECTTTCSWHLSGRKFAAASVKGNFSIYDLDGNRRHSREGVRVQCLSFLHKDPDVILAADKLNRIKSYAINDMSLQTEEKDILEEKHSIMSFTIDQQDRYIAVNLMEQGVHLWDYDSKTLLRVFPDVCQRDFTIHSSFSSPNPTFLASGSEDGKVYIYNVNKDQPVAILHGHHRCVNCVTWNPKFPELLVSTSDDRMVRLWGPPCESHPDTHRANGN